MGSGFYIPCSYIAQLFGYPGAPGISYVWDLESIGFGFLGFRVEVFQFRLQVQDVGLPGSPGESSITEVVAQSDLTNDLYCPSTPAISTY